MEIQTRVILSVLSGLATAFTAKKKGQNPYLWLGIGLVLGAFGVFGFFFVPSAKKRGVKSKQRRAKERYLIGPIDRFWHYVDISGNPEGPVSHTALSRALREGKINEKTLIWHDQMKDWKELKNFLLE
jgi:hypothetical protein